MFIDLLLAQSVMKRRLWGGLFLEWMSSLQRCSLKPLCYSVPCSFKGTFHPNHKIHTECSRLKRCHMATVVKTLSLMAPNSRTTTEKKSKCFFSNHNRRQYPKRWARTLVENTISGSKSGETTRGSRWNAFTEDKTIWQGGKDKHSLYTRGEDATMTHKSQWRES